MMRMLYFGGLEILATKNRVENATNTIGNIHGDYEFENLEEELTTLGPELTAGKVIKIVAPYIHHVPLDRPVKVIFMVRDIHEIISSLMAMGVIWEHTPQEAIPYARNFLTYNDISTHYVQFKDFTQYPMATAIGVEDFIGQELDTAGMMKAFDAKARNKKILKGNILKFEAKPYLNAPDKEQEEESVRGGNTVTRSGIH